MSGGCITFVVTVDAGQHRLCVIEGGRFHVFRVTLQNLARLNVESAERLLQAVPGAYAHRLGAPALESDSG